MRRPQVSLDGLQHTLCTTRPTALPSLNARVLHASVFLGAPIVCPPVAPGVRRAPECSTRRGATITCMAHPRRVARVAKQIEREVGNMLLYDRTMKDAINPERKRGLDAAVSALASVTEVVVSNDLQVAKIYVSVYSDQVGKDQAMTSLKKLEGYVRKHIGKQIRLRLTPEIRFLLDDSIDRSERVNALLERIKLQQAGLVEPPPITLPPELEDDEDDVEKTYGDWIAAADLDTQLQQETSQGAGARTRKGRRKAGPRVEEDEDEDEDESMEELDAEMEDLLDAFQEQLEAEGGMLDDDEEEGFFVEEEVVVEEKQSKGRGRRRR